MATFTLCSLVGVERHRCWPLGITEKVRGPQGHEPWALCPSLAKNIQDGTAIFFFLNHFCFSTDITSDQIGPLVQSLKLCQKANSSPPWGLALNLPGLDMFCGTHGEAICDSSRVSFKPASPAEKSWCFPPGLHAFLFICEPFLFVLINLYPILIRASTTADAKPQRDLLET